MRERYSQVLVTLGEVSRPVDGRSRVTFTLTECPMNNIGELLIRTGQNGNVSDRVRTGRDYSPVAEKQTKRERVLVAKNVTGRNPNVHPVPCRERVFMRYSCLDKPLRTPTCTRLPMRMHLVPPPTSIGDHPRDGTESPLGAEG